MAIEARDKRGRVQSNYRPEQLYEVVRVIAEEAKPEHPESISVREFNKARAETGHDDAPTAQTICGRLADRDGKGMSWKRVKEIAFDETASIDHIERRRHSAAPIAYLSERGVYFALRLIAKRLGVTTLTPGEYEDERLVLLKEERQRDPARPLVAQLIPTAGQVEQYFVSSSADDDDDRRDRDHDHAADGDGRRVDDDDVDAGDDDDRDDNNNYDDIAADADDEERKKKEEEGKDDDGSGAGGAGSGGGGTGGGRSGGGNAGSGGRGSADDHQLQLHDGEAAWDRALAAAELEPRDRLRAERQHRGRREDSLPLVEAVDLFVDLNSRLPSKQDMNEFSEQADVQLEALRGRRWHDVLQEAIDHRGLTGPTEMPKPSGGAGGKRRRPRVKASAPGSLPGVARRLRHGTSRYSREECVAALVVYLMNLNGRRPTKKGYGRYATKNGLPSAGNLDKHGGWKELLEEARAS